MIDQMDESNVLAEIIGWVAVNLLAMAFIGVLLNVPNIPAIANNDTAYQMADILSSISLLGGGILIAGFQSIILRHLLPQITGGRWIWIISGVASSILVFWVVAFSILGLGDYPTGIDYLFFTVLVIGEQMISLSIIQGFVLHANKYQGVRRWVISNIIGYGLAVVFSYYVIYQWTNIFEVRIILPALLAIGAAGLSGWELIQARESRGDSPVDNSIPEASSKYRNSYFVQANLENQDFHGQNFDGMDFRKANLRMAILEDASCEPRSVKKMGPGCLFFFLEALSGGHATVVPPFFVQEMKSTNFSEADLTGANLKRVKLRESIIRNAILRNANLSEASLVNADLSEADLSNANLSYTDLSGALLYKTNLEGADLTGAKLDGTDFEDASLENAILHNVDLRKVKYLDIANLTGADLSSTILPEKK